MRPIAITLLCLAPGCALAHEVSIDANVDVGGSADVTRPCTSDTAGLNRDCGWTIAGSVPCSAGARVQVGCAAGCGLGSCNGDSMIRVCDSVPCRSPQALGANDDASSCGGGLCSFVPDVRCPASGQLLILTAPYGTGGTYACSIATR